MSNHTLMRNIIWNVATYYQRKTAENVLMLLSTSFEQYHWLNVVLAAIMLVIHNWWVKDYRAHS